MKLLTKAIEKAFEKQGYTGDKSAKDIKVICKFFNPTGGHSWWLYERDSQDPNIFWAFVCDGNPAFAECGTVSLQELQSFRGRMGLGIERDRSFDIGEKTVQQVIDEVTGQL